MPSKPEMWQVPGPILAELVECLEEAAYYVQRASDDDLKRRVDLALEDYKFSQAVTRG